MRYTLPGLSPMRTACVLLEGTNKQGICPDNAIKVVWREIMHQLFLLGEVKARYVDLSLKAAGRVGQRRMQAAAHKRWRKS